MRNAPEIKPSAALPRGSRKAAADTAERMGRKHVGAGPVAVVHPLQHVCSGFIPSEPSPSSRKTPRGTHFYCTERIGVSACERDPDQVRTSDWRHGDGGEGWLAAS